MINSNELKTAIELDLAREFDTSADLITFRIAYDMLRIANRDLAAALDAPNDDLRYYYSDDHSDDLSNPTYPINAATAIMNSLYDDPDDRPAMIAEFIDCLEQMIDFDICDDEYEFTSLDALAELIKTAAS